MIALPATTELAVWQLAISSDQATVTTWTPATTPTTATDNWVAAQGVPVNIGLSVVSGSVEFSLSAAGADWCPLVSGWSPGAVRIDRIRLRTAVDSSAAVVQISATRRFA